MNDRDILEKAAHIIERDGWCQYRLHGLGNSSHCMMGGIVTAMGETYGKGWDKEQGPLRVYYDAMDKVMHEVHSPVPPWNDVATRTVEDVLLALKKAALR